MKDVGGVAETRFLGRTAGLTDGRNNAPRADEGHFYSPPPPTSGDKEIISYCLVDLHYVSYFNISQLHIGPNNK